MKRLKRFAALIQRPVNQDGLVDEWPEERLIAVDSPSNPVSSAKVDNGLIAEPGGKRQDQFDMIDRFVVDYVANVERTERTVRPEAVEIAHMLVGIHVSREEIIIITIAITPAEAVEVMAQMNAVEMMMALQKTHTHRTPSSQCRVTNLKDNSVQIATDVAEAEIHSFSKQETTIGITCCAPLNALALLVGSQCGRPGVLMRCSVEEATELELGMRGLTSYTETVSICGTEVVFTDGDDTPWSKTFLAPAYASRGLKMRCTSGTGSEALMGHSESKPMLYLESRCIFITRGAGVQELQNGAASCIGMIGATPSDIRAVLAENLIASMLDLEVAPANDQIFSRPDIRRTAYTLMQVSPGTDFVFPGYSTVPNYDNMFAGSNSDAKDFDDYSALQHDLMVDGGLCPVTETETIAIRQRAAWAIQAVFRELGLPSVAGEEVEVTTYAHDGSEMPPRSVVEDLSAAEEVMEHNIIGPDIVGALNCNSFEDTASNILNMLHQWVTGDYLQTSTILDWRFEAMSAVNDINDYQGPDTGYHIPAEHWAEIKNIPGVARPGTIE